MQSHSKLNARRACSHGGCSGDCQGVPAALMVNPNETPTDVTLRNILQHYQDSRPPRVRELVKISGDLTRLQTYDGWKYSPISRWLTPITGLDMLAKNIAVLRTSAPKAELHRFYGEGRPIALARLCCIYLCGPTDGCEETGLR